MSTPLLSSVLEATTVAQEESIGKMERFGSLSRWSSLAYWLRLSPDEPPPSKRAVLDRLSIDIALIDRLVGEQLDAVLHHPRFQALEASWLGLQRLTEQVEDADDNVKIRLLDVTWRELVRDLDRAIEFDQSHLFRKVYTAEFGMPGGEPFGVLLGDYAIRHGRSQTHPEDDVGALRSIAQVAAASFAPFVAGAHPSLLDLDSFRDLERPIDLGHAFVDPAHTAWNALRDLEDTRFVGLTLPRTLMRLPYRDDPVRADGFRYEEDVTAPDGSHYLWGSAIYAFGEVLIRTFIENGWMAGIRGVERDSETGGLVTTLPGDWFQTDAPELVPKGSLEVQLTDDQEKELGELGFIPLSHCQGTALAAFYGNQSIQRWRDPAREGKSRTVAEINAKLSSMLQYMFCVSRFAHYVKVIGRDKVGSHARASEIERLLNDWLISYATSNESAPPEVQAKYPLRDARVEVREIPGRPGVYQSIVHLRPHFQLDQMTSSVKLVTELFATSQL